MHATHWLIGCGLCIASIAVVAAPRTDTLDVDSATRTTATDSASARDAGTPTGNDVLGLGHDADQHGGGADTNEAPAASNRSGTHAPVPARAPHVGWQSLLPGSIQ